MNQFNQFFLTSSSMLSVPLIFEKLFTVSYAIQYRAISFPVSMKCIKLGLTLALSAKPAVNRYLVKIQRQGTARKGASLLKGITHTEGQTQSYENDLKWDQCISVVNWQLIHKRWMLFCLHNAQCYQLLCLNQLFLTVAWTKIGRRSHQDQEMQCICDALEEANRIIVQPNVIATYLLV